MPSQLTDNELVEIFNKLNNSSDRGIFSDNRSDNEIDNVAMVD